MASDVVALHACAKDVLRMNSAILARLDELYQGFPLTLDQTGAEREALFALRRVQYHAQNGVRSACQAITVHSEQEA